MIFQDLFIFDNLAITALPTTLPLAGCGADKKGYLEWKSQAFISRGSSPFMMGLSPISRRLSRNAGSTK